MMYLCLSSMSQCPQTKVTWLVKNISLVLILLLLGLLHTHPVVSSPVQVQPNTHQLRYCRFETTNKVYNVNDLLKCMNELVPRARHRKSRSADDKVQLFMSYKDKNVDESQFVPHADARNFYTDLVGIHRGPLPRKDGNYYQYPGQYYPTDSNSRPGILGINLLEAFSSINKYDDRKCVHRIICEVASGVTPGNIGYKRSNSIFGISSLIDYLTTRTFDISSPLLTFGKSALMGWNHRGNPDVCYHRYPQCPRSQNELISYLNNYNGGFFRFFNYRNSGNYNRASDPVDSPLVSDRKATGELKFDSPSSKTVLVERSKKNDHNKIVFPDEHFVKIMDYTDSDKFNNSPESSFFPQDRKDQKVEELVYDFHSDKSSQSEDNPSAVQVSQQESRGSRKKHGKLYMPTKNPLYSTKKLSSYTFPDGQRIMIDTTFSKLFSDSYKKPLKRGVVNNAPRAIDMEGLYVINLTELYPGSTVDDDTRSPLEEEVIHPCDMICHDSRGTAVQFNQFINSNDDNTDTNNDDNSNASADKNDSLNTLMTPEHPILDLSKNLPCQVICLNARGQRRRISTTFNRVIRSRLTSNQEGDSQSGKIKIIKPRFVGEPIIYDKHPIIQLSDSHVVPLSSLPWTGGSGIVDPSWGQKSPTMPTLSDDPDTPAKVIGPVLSFEKGDTVIGDNPLTITTNLSSSNQPLDSGYPSEYSANLQRQSPPATTITICNGRIYIMPANTVTTPICATNVDSESNTNNIPLLNRQKNKWGNYTYFFQQLATSHNDDPYSFNNHQYNLGLNVSADKIIPINEQRTSPKPGKNEFELTTIHYAVSSTHAPPVSEAPPEQDYVEYSCLDNETWDSKNKQCTPNSESVDNEDTEEETEEFRKIPISQRSGRRQRIVIKTPHANMYIQST